MYSKTTLTPNYYTILGVTRKATFEEIKAAYHKKALANHPDKNKNLDATEIMQQLNHIYDVLSQEDSRRQYDNTLPVDSEKFYAKQATSSFFNRNRQNELNPDVFTFEQWNVKLQGDNLFIFHPSFQGCKDNITIFNVLQNATLVLPVNNKMYLHRRVKNYVLSISNNYTTWSDGMVEFMFNLPHDKQVKQNLLNGIFTIYNLPKEVVNFIYQTMYLPKINTPQQHKSFEDLFDTQVGNYKKLHLGQWELSLTSAHLFIAHPSLQGPKNDITFFTIYTDPIVALPINGNQLIKKHLMENLVRVSKDSLISCNHVEMIFKLPTDKASLDKILSVVFYIYNFPEELITAIQKLAIILEDSVCNNFSL